MIIAVASINLRSCLYEKYVFLKEKLGGNAIYNQALAPSLFLQIFESLYRIK
jgi:hypothetical protein